MGPWHRPPTADAAYTVLDSRIEHRRGNGVKVRVVDANTLRVGIDFRHCDPARLVFADGRVVELDEYEPKMNVTPNAVALKD